MSSAEVSRRLPAAISIALVVVAGLYARSQRPDANESEFLGFLATYGGDTLWPVMFFFIGRFVLPTANRLYLAASTLAFTLAIEFAQLWSTPVLDWLRAQPVSGFILGHTFLWSDVLCLVVGSALAILLDLMLVRLFGTYHAAATRSVRV